MYEVDSDMFTGKRKEIKKKLSVHPCNISRSRGIRVQSVQPTASMHTDTQTLSERGDNVLVVSVSMREEGADSWMGGGLVLHIGVQGEKNY